jgi:probable O-glycosylation ligase (exosortase A-associated)
MRDYVIVAIIFGSLPFCFRWPYIGVLMWSWVSYMNPHRLGWGIAVHSNPTYYIGLATLSGFLFTKDRDRLPWTTETVLLSLLWLLFTITSFYAFYPDLAWQQWDKVSKILLMTFVTILLTTDREKVKYLLLVIAFSVGFYGFKGGIFSILTGGQHRIYGPPGTFLEDNNDLAQGLLMILPILFYIGREEQNQKWRFVLFVIGFLSILSVIFTYSRGGFVALTAQASCFLIKSRKKLFGITVALLSAYLFFNILPNVLPEQWWARMKTITDHEGYEQEGSIRGRFNAWHVAWNLALDRPFTGGGFETFHEEIFERYAPDPNDVHDVHSSYFEMLGEHGFIGLTLYLSLIISSLLSLQKLKITFANSRSHYWITNYADILQLSIVAYLVSGAFLGRAYFDLFYHMIALVIVLKSLSRREYEIMNRQRDFSDRRLIRKKQLEKRVVTA